MRIAALVLLGFMAPGLVVSCGVPISDSEPLVYVAPLVGTWALETATDTELQFTVPGGQPLYVAQFEFDASEITLGGLTSFEGSADGALLEFRDPNSGAVMFSGELIENTMILLSDGRRFTRAFAPDLLSGQWVDVNTPSRIYRIDAADPQAIAIGCAYAPHPEEDDKELQGVLEVTYDGDVIDLFEIVAADGLVSVRAPGVFIGASAMRIARIEGYLFLQRRDVSGTCEDLKSP